MAVNCLTLTLTNFIAGKRLMALGNIVLCVALINEG